MQLALKLAYCLSYKQVQMLSLRTPGWQVFTYNTVTRLQSDWHKQW
jgi:hypothetical protein